MSLFLMSCLTTVFVFMSFVMPTTAQDSSGRSLASQAAAMSDEEWQATIGRISSETAELLTENEKLNAEYEFLKQRAATLKKELEARRAEVKKTGSGSSKATASGLGLESPEMAALQQEIETIEAENMDLQKQLSDLQEKNRLWRLQESQLSAEKRDALIDLNYQDAQSDAEGAVSAEIQELRAQLDKTLAEEKRLNEELARLSQQAARSPRESAELNRKNRELEKEIRALKKEIAAQEKKNQKAMAASAKKAPESQRVSPELLKQKKELEKEVAKLSAQLDGVNATVTQSKDVLGQKRQLMDQIMSLDAENQALRAQIDQLLAEPQPQ